MSKAKGNSFEREICKTLSLWWTGKKRDDVFWRTATSGGRAKVRSKQGDSTFGQYGDIQATDPIGQPLIDIATIELKRGYQSSTFADLVEPSTHPNANPCNYEKFLQQVIEDSLNAESFAWMLIVKRNARQHLILMPFHLYKKFRDLKLPISSSPCFYLKCFFLDGKEHKIFGTTLDSFLKVVKPHHIRTIQIREKPSTKSYKKQVCDLDKEAQTYKCITCDEEAVIWDGTVEDWICVSCGATNDYPK